MERPDLPTGTPVPPTGKNNRPWDCTTTGIEMVEKQSRLPTTENRQYLHIKVEYAMRFPDLSAAVRRKGQTSNHRMNLKQILMSSLIRLDEIGRDYCWYYKAEVAFDMRTSPPRPFLSSTLLDKDGPGRRHTTNPFPVPGSGIYRRPDVIIVKDKRDRWPGLAGTDAEGNTHADNLARLVEVKFPGDVLSPGQYRDYMLIVGNNRIRMTILEIHDCRPEEQQWVDQVVNVTMKAWKTSGAKYWPLVLNPPIFMPRPPATPAAAKVEPWTYAGKAVADLNEGAIRGVAEGWNALSKETRQTLKKMAGWLNDSGEWVYQQAKERWIWFSRTDRYVAEWSNHQIRAAWAVIQLATDITLEMLKQVDWVQVLTDVGKTVGVIVVVVGAAAAVFYLGIPAAVIELFLLILRLAITAWDKLALILGSGAAAGSVAY